MNRRVAKKIERRMNAGASYRESTHLRALAKLYGLEATTVKGLDVVFHPDLTEEQRLTFLNVVGDLFEAAGGKGGLKVEPIGRCRRFHSDVIPCPECGEVWAGEVDPPANPG